MHHIINNEDSKSILFKKDKPINFKLELDPLEKYCADTLQMQGSKGESALLKTLRKERNLVNTYGSKLDKLSQVLKQTGEGEA